MPQDTRVAIKVWDLPVRLFHWLIVLLLVFQVVTGQIGGSLMEWHAYSGYAILVLIVFRILWGFAGSTHARFASFLAGPAATYRFALRLFSREAVPQVGHNPLGGWMVIALIVSLALQAASGLFAYDGAGAEGPLASLVSFESLEPPVAVPPLELQAAPGALVRAYRGSALPLAREEGEPHRRDVHRREARAGGRGARAA
jgi:cytochrome b